MPLLGSLALLLALVLLLGGAAVHWRANRANLRWVSQLGGLARQIGSSEDAELPNRPGFSGAPAPVRDLAAELLRLHHTIIDREQLLRRSVATQSAVARELHHRVRNNLQVMASLISLQADDIAAGEARRALEQAQLRISTMAMVNRLVYAEAEVATVDMAQLLDPLADLLNRYTGIDGRVIVDRTLAPRAVDIDRAMPLALWIIEAAVCLYERADPNKRPHLFTISTAGEDDGVCIVVTMSGLLPDAQRASLQRRLVVAIAHQLGGRSRIDDVGVSEGKIVLSLPHEDLPDGATPAELSVGAC